jgi:hypothetical protein
MYTNVSNIIKTLVQMLNENRDAIEYVIREYEPERTLTVFEGMRKTLPRDAFPSFEVEPTSGSNNWATTRAQRPRYNFQCTLTVINDNEKYGVEYIATIVNVLVELMTDPTNLQMRVLNESRWDPNGGLVDTYILDSLVEDVTYNASKDGTIRTAEFGWFALIHEPFPESKWEIGDDTMPTIIRPKLVDVA